MDRLNRTAANLKEHGFQVQVFDAGAQARDEALRLIGSGSVGFGGSMTVSGLGLYETLQEKGNSVYWHWKAPSKDALPAIFDNARKADFYLCSTNAILESGALLNIDGSGNRVAAMFSGPKTLIVIAGQNKLCGDYSDALARIKREACPPNGRRLNMKTPCTATGVCNDCKGPDRMCRVTVLLERPSFHLPNVHILLVKEDLGY